MSSLLHDDEDGKKITLHGNDFGKLNVDRQKTYAIKVVKEAVAVQKDIRTVRDRVEELEEVIDARRDQFKNPFDLLALNTVGPVPEVGEDRTGDSRAE